MAMGPFQAPTCCAPTLLHNAPLAPSLLDFAPFLGRKRYSPVLSPGHVRIICPIVGGSLESTRLTGWNIMISMRLYGPADIFASLSDEAFEEALLLSAGMQLYYK